MTGARPRCNDTRCGNALVVCGTCAPWVARMLRAKAARFETEAPEFEETLAKMVADGMRSRAADLDSLAD